MKNLTKIFMAVAVAMFAFSCATDTTEDLGVQLGNGENGATVELALSLEESRTQLGTKKGEFYPLYWSEGDKISVNGVESGEAQIVKNDPGCAIFEVAAADAYEIAYPVAPQGQVLFAAEQNHVAAGNTFESGVSTMYATAVAGEPITLQHLTGVLKFAVKGSAVLSKIQISTIDRAPIAGAFDIDFATGELTATEASKKVIEYSFGEEGLQLTSEAQWMHVAVPAGQYDELYLTIYEKENACNVMYATVKANDDPETEKVEKPLAVGCVREFKTPISYSPNAQLFVIDSPERLAEFKSAIESEAGLTMDAILTEDIDMTDVEWTAITGNKYTKTIYGNGYAIKGLTAPLFHTTSASFKGLHLVDVNINTNGVYRLGAFVELHQPSGDVYPSIENCSVSGTIEVNNPELAGNTNAIYGGFVGTAAAVTFDSCVSDVDINIEQLNATNRSKKVYIGGICGYVEGRTPEGVDPVYTTFVNSKNYGNINMSGCDGIVITTESAIGGILGNSCLDTDNIKSNFGLLIDNCENNGGITIYGAIKLLYLGGISGYSPSSAEVIAKINKSVNRGPITIKSGSAITEELHWGGIAGMHNNANGTNGGTLINNTNEETGTLTMESGATFAEACVGGIVGTQRSPANDTVLFQDCTNNGAINFGGDAKEGKTVSLRLGGVAGYTQVVVNTVTNNGAITVSGNLNGNSAANLDFKTGCNVYIGGVFGYRTVSSNTGLVNNGDITLSANITSIAAEGKLTQVDLGGIFGYSSRNANDGVSDGKITVSGNTTGCQLCIGGVYGHIYAAISATTTTCNAEIEISGKHTGNLYVGGITPAHIYDIDDQTFGGTINVVEGTEIGGECAIGGIVGILRGYTSTQIIAEDLTNNGSITFAGTTNGTYITKEMGKDDAGNDVEKDKINYYTPYIAGCVGLSDTEATVADALAPQFVKVYNNGAVTFSGNASGDLYIAGVGAIVNNETKYISNLGKINIGGKAAATVYVGGLFCKSGDITYGNNGVKGDKDKGAINFTGIANKLVCGGIIYQSPGAVAGVANYAPITISGSTGNTVYLGGVSYAGPASGITWKKCINYGKITFSGIVGDESIEGSDKSADIFAGGVIGTAVAGTSAAWLEQCQNHGDIDFTKDLVLASANRSGGLCGRLEGKSLLVFNKCWNSGNITFSGKASARSAGNFMLGGLISYVKNASGKFYIWGDNINSGNITVDGDISGADATVLGGAIGYCALTIRKTSKGNGAVINTGRVNYTCGDKGTTTTFAMGGACAWLDKITAEEDISFVNTGDITATGSAATASKNSYIGGAIGYAANTIPSVQCYCTVNAAGFNYNDTWTKYDYVGMLVGTTSTGAPITAGGVGGKIYTMTQEEDAGGTVDVLADIDLSADNWYNYIYCTPLDAAPEGITLLEAKPVVTLPAALYPEKVF